jgi:DNA-binding transcriptional regulator YdaS (Cro superfamily)
MANKENLANELTTLLNRQAYSWAKVSSLLQRVERTGHWESQAESFTDWIRFMARQLGVTESTLWRYLGAGRYYQQLRKRLQASNIDSPTLEKLQNIVSPENLEILEKIERVVPRKRMQEIAQRTIAGKVTRHELRELWKTYRPVLQGRTARGRGTKTPKVDLADERQHKVHTEATVINILMSTSPEWTGIRAPDFYRVMRDIKIPNAFGSEKSIFDVLVLVRETPTSPLLTIGVEVKAGTAKKEWAMTLCKLAYYCDRLWLVLADKIRSEDLGTIPEFVGLLRADKGKLKVKRLAQDKGPGLGLKTCEMAKELLVEVLKT